MIQNILAYLGNNVFLRHMKLHAVCLNRFQGSVHRAKNTDSHAFFPKLTAFLILSNVAQKVTKASQKPARVTDVLKINGVNN